MPQEQPFLEAILKGNVFYEDTAFHTNRRFFVDCLEIGQFMITVNTNVAKYRFCVDGRRLFDYLRSWKVSLEQGWQVYQCVIR